MGPAGDLLVAVFASTGFWSLMTMLVQRKSENRTAERKALLALLHERVYKLCNQYISQGYVTTDQYDNLKYLTDAYEKLGGNGTGRRLKQEVDTLPIKTEEDERYEERND
jgi:DNA/RNA endonuclease YhcR with UshA esterase domain